MQKCFWMFNAETLCMEKRLDSEDGAIEVQMPIFNCPPPHDGMHPWSRKVAEFCENASRTYGEKQE
jgi:hypothetical protein